VQRVLHMDEVVHGCVVLVWVARNFGNEWLLTGYFGEHMKACISEDM